MECSTVYEQRPAQGVSRAAARDQRREIPPSADGDQRYAALDPRRL